MIVDYWAANENVESISWPYACLEDVRGLSERTIFQGYCKMPLDEDTHEAFAMVVYGGLYMPTWVQQGVKTRKETYSSHHRV